MKTLQTDLENSCYEALDTGLIGNDIVDHMVRENSFRHRELTEDDLRGFAKQVYKSVAEILADGYTSV